MKIPKLFAIAISVAVLSVLAHAAPSTAKKLGKTVRRRRRAAPRVSARARAKAQAFVAQQIEDGAKIPVENAAGLLPFFEQLFRNQQAALKGPVRILQYGDSHTAADLWTGELRSRFQEKFGDGGSGFSLAGRPYRGYRRADVLSGSSSGWHADGLVGHAAGDGVYGLGGISLSTRLPGQTVYLEATGDDFELFYYQQPEGGDLLLSDNSIPAGRISTRGAAGAGYFHFSTNPGFHRLELKTVDRAPVRLFGWTAEKQAGVTYEELGINGAEASIFNGWDPQILRSNIEKRAPALIVLAYGTNEAGRASWTLESYRDMFSQIIARLREAAPTAAILAIGPPDRERKTRKGWLAMDKIGTIIEAQREAALENGCSFWDLRAKTGGKGAMKEWVAAGMAQYDHVHFTGAGYHVIGDALFRDLMSQYERFLKARENTITDAARP